MTEAHARLYLRSHATLFDAVTVIVLVEHTLISCLFGLDPTPSVMFRDLNEYKEVRNVVL
jgi:hypothetical protein